MKIMEWIKEHKVEILIVTGTAVLGGLCIYGVSKQRPKVDMNKLLDAARKIKTEKLELDGFDVGMCNRAVKYPDDGTIGLQIDNIKLEQMGDLGEEIMKRVPELPTNHMVGGLFSIIEYGVQN